MESIQSAAEDEFDWQPLYLSSIAGASTCIGAAVVFCFPPSKNDSRQRQVPPGMMAFSLALAGSVMVTVSFISILPECLKDDSHRDNEDINILDAKSTGSGTGTGSSTSEEEEMYKMIPFFSWMMLSRILFFGLGCGLYFALSSFFVAEPEELMNSESFNVLVGTKADMNVNVHGHGLSSQDEEERIELLHGSLKSKTSENGDDNNDDSAAVAAAMNGDMGTDEDEETRPILLETLDGSPMNSIRGRKNAKAATLRTNITSNPRDSTPSKNKRQDKDDSSPLKIRGVMVTSNGNSGFGYGFGAWTTGKDLQSKEKQKAWRLAMLLFISLLVHNFPEGLAVAASALESPSLGITVTIGIMIHNIPEGIAIAIPCLAARPDQPWLSFALASVSGLAEPFGAFVALIFLRGVDHTNSSPDAIMSLENILAFVAGIMVIVAVWELFPEAKRHITDTSAYFWFGTIFGIIIMVLTELYLP